MSNTLTESISKASPPPKTVPISVAHEKVVAALVKLKGQGFVDRAMESCGGGKTIRATTLLATLLAEATEEGASPPKASTPTNPAVAAVQRAANYLKRQEPAPAESVIEQYQSISNPTERANFYAAHKSEIHNERDKVKREQAQAKRQARLAGRRHN